MAPGGAALGSTSATFSKTVRHVLAAQKKRRRLDQREAFLDARIAEWQEEARGRLRRAHLLDRPVGGVGALGRIGEAMPRIGIGAEQPADLIAALRPGI